jgi:hypothetical protein
VQPLAEDRIGVLPTERGAYQKSASVGQSAISVNPVTPAMTMETRNEMTRSAGSTWNVIGWPAMIIAWRPGSSA